MYDDRRRRGRGQEKVKLQGIKWGTCPSVKHSGVAGRAAPRVPQRSVPVPDAAPRAAERGMRKLPRNMFEQLPCSKVHTTHADMMQSRVNGTDDPCSKQC